MGFRAMILKLVSIVAVAGALGVQYSTGISTRSMRIW